MAETRLLGEILVEHGIISPSQLEEAVAYQKSRPALAKETFSLMALIEKAKLEENKEADPHLLGDIVVKKGFAALGDVQQALQIQQVQFELTRHLNAEQLRTLLGISSALNSTINLVDLLTLIMESANKVVNAEASSLMILDERTQELVFSVPTGPKKDEMTEVRIASDKGIAGWVLTQNQPVLIPDVTQDQRFFHGFDKSFDFETRSIICVPLLLKGSVKGVLEVLNKKDGSSFDESDLYLLKTFANQAGIALENARLRQEEVEKQRLFHEVALANQIQTALLPHRTPNLSGLEIAGHLKPATEISGDFYDYIELGGQKLAVVIGDISGKGVAAGLLMSASRSSLRTKIETHPSIAEAVHEVNRLLIRDAECRFVTLFLALIDLEKRTLSYSNCGHTPGLLYRKRSQEVRELSVGGTILGAFEDFGYSEDTLKVEPGDTVVLYTDGVTDEETPAGEKFGSDRLYKLLEENAHLDAEGIIRCVADAVSDFMAGAAQKDDLTVLALKFG
jgi:sigma-B regulation protein RsbU (phosphoserine phosphatase)